MFTLRFGFCVVFLITVACRSEQWLRLNVFRFIFVVAVVGGGLCTFHVVSASCYGAERTQKTTEKSWVSSVIFLPYF